MLSLSVSKERTSNVVEAAALKIDTLHRVNHHHLTFLVNFIFDLERDVLVEICNSIALGDAELEVIFGDIGHDIIRHFRKSALIKAFVKSKSWLDLESQFVTEYGVGLGFGDDSVTATPPSVDVEHREFFHEAVNAILHHCLVQYEDRFSGKAFRIKDLSMLQQYLWFKSVREVVLDNRHCHSGESLVLQFRQDFVNRMVYLRRIERWYSVHKSDFAASYAVLPYHNFEYEYVEALPPHVMTVDVNSFPFIEQQSSKRGSKNKNRNRNSSSNNRPLAASTIEILSTSSSQGSSSKTAKKNTINSIFPSTSSSSSSSTGDE
jgi:hypothetical protein